MFESLVITLREGVEAALIVGIVLGYLRKAGRESWNRIVWWGVGWAVVASLVAAYFVHRWEVTEEAYEGWMMLAGAIFVASVVYWMWKTGKRMKQEIEGKLSALAEKPSQAAAFGLFAFVFLMVTREGIETVLFLAAVSLRTTELLNFMGGVLGLALAVGLGVAFFKGSLKVDLRKFFRVTSILLFVVAGQLLISGVHELSEGLILPASRREMAIVGPIVNNDAFFFMVIVGLALFLVLAEKFRQSGRSGEALESMSAPARRKVLADIHRERFWKMAATGASCLVMIFISADFIYSRVAQAMTPPVQLAVTKGVVRLPVAKLTDHNLHRYVVNQGGVAVRFIAIVDSSDTVHVALDACQICGAKGYYQNGRNVICRNCGAAIYIPTIGQAGGCNPIPMDFVIENNTIVIPASALAAGAGYFR